MTASGVCFRLACAAGGAGDLLDVCQNVRPTLSADGVGRTWSCGAGQLMALWPVQSPGRSTFRLASVPTSR